MPEEKNLEVQRLLLGQRALRTMADSMAAWWRRISEAAATALTSDNLEQLCREAVRALNDALGASEVSILIASDDGAALVRRISVGLGQPEPVEVLIPAGQGMAGRVLGSKAPLIVDDLSRVELKSPTLRDQGLRSVVAVPIIANDRVFGVLHAGSYELQHFDETDAELLCALAERLAVALERVQVFEEQRRLAEIATFLADTARIMAEASDLTAALDRLAAAALPALGDICLVDRVDDQGYLERLVARHADPSRQPLVDRLREDFAPSASGPHPAVRVLELGEPQWSPTMTDDFLRSTTHDEEHFSLVKELGFRSYMAVPIASGDRTVGALTVVSCSRQLSERDVQLAERLAEQVAAVAAKAEMLDAMARTSHVLQEALLPSELPDISGLQICTAYFAASSSLEVGGDFFDVIAQPGGGAWFMIGDIEGHDGRAAAIMGQLRSAARTLALEGHAPAGVINGLRGSWAHYASDRTATILFGQIEASGKVVLSSAGHLPPLLVGAGSAEFVVLSPGPPLGVESRVAPELVFTISPGEVLLLYTDGALAERLLDVEAAMEDLRKTVLAAPTGVDEICDYLEQLEVERYDDVALLGLAVEGDAAGDAAGGS